MKIKQLVILCVLATLISCGKSAITSTKMKSDSDSLSYAFGVNIYYYTLQQDSLPLNATLIAKGFIEASEGKAFLDGTTSVGFINTALNAREQERLVEQAKQNKITYEKNIQRGDSFLQKNRENPGVIVTPSGLQYKVITMGTGDKPAETDIVKVHYTGTLLDGTKFDSSIDRGSPAEFQVNGVIQGWVEALQLMPVGSKFMLYIPDSLAYGANGAGDVIQPYSTLIFEVELLGITKQ